MVPEYVPASASLVVRYVCGSFAFGVVLYFSLTLKLLRLRASSYNGAAASKERRLEDRAVMRLLMDLGSCLVIEGGCLDWLCMNRGLSFNLR